MISKLKIGDNNCSKLTFDITSDSLEVLMLLARMIFEPKKHINPCQRITHVVLGNARNGGQAIDFRSNGSSMAGIVLFKDHILTAPNEPQATIYPIVAAEDLYNFMKGWLNQAEYGKPPNTDGDVCPGFRASRDTDDSVITLCTEWVVYGK